VVPCDDGSRWLGGPHGDPQLIDWRDTLLTIAEVAIAITGFSGLIGIFARRERLQNLSSEFFKLRWMLDYSLATLFASLIPFLVFAADISEPAAWRASSTAVLAAGAIYLVASRDMISRMARQPGWVGGIFAVGDVLVTVLLLLNALGGVFAPQALPYLGFVFWCLLGSVAGFVQLVALAWSGTEE
jgi:hypothetical protein